ncbi:hypothetical protein [Methyloglobulus sp.]|uniref:hypothetical protein n=1 Tax=Methyloglobulus sp. TaxID=2518622 RepID=UPI0032B80217
MFLPTPEPENPFMSYIWVGLSFCAFLTAIIFCLNKRFQDRIFYRKYCYFWWWLTGILCLISIAVDRSLGNYCFSSAPFMSANCHKPHFLFSAFALLLLTLVPAKLQNLFFNAQK